MFLPQKHALHLFMVSSAGGALTEYYRLDYLDSTHLLLCFEAYDIQVHKQHGWTLAFLPKLCCAIEKANTINKKSHTSKIKGREAHTHVHTHHHHHK